MWVLLLSGAACSCARDGVSRTLLLVSVEVSEARSSMSTIDVDTVHSDERTISLSSCICVHYIRAFHWNFQLVARNRSTGSLIYGVSRRLEEVGSCESHLKFPVGSTCAAGASGAGIKETVSDFVSD